MLKLVLCAITATTCVLYVLTKLNIYICLYIFFFNEATRNALLLISVNYQSSMMSTTNMRQLFFSSLLTKEISGNHEAKLTEEKCCESEKKVSHAYVQDQISLSIIFHSKDSI